MERGMRRVMVAVAAVAVLAGCGQVAEGPSATSTTVNRAYDDDGSTAAEDALEAQREAEGQRLQEEWERQQAEDAGPSATSTTLDARELLCAKSPDC